MINTANIPKAYSEVYEFINALGEEYINKLPSKVYNSIKGNRDMNYKPIYDKNQRLDTSMISKEALSLISALNLQYWCEESQEKERLKKAYVENQKIEDEKYSYDNLFKKDATQDDITNEEKIVSNKETQLIEVKEENVIDKILRKIKNFILKFRHI